MEQNDLIEYVAKYIHGLKPNHRANVAFKSRLAYYGDEAYSNPDNTIFPYSFPISEHDDIIDDGFIGYAENKPAISIVPLGGEPPRYAMNAWTPYFYIDCRHRIIGCAFRCLQYLTFELDQNSRVFPQNGTILALTSQPTRVYGDYRNNVFVFRSSFRALIAEPIL